jgi:hypothetical protein
VPCGGLPVHWVVLWGDIPVVDAGGVHPVDLDVPVRNGFKHLAFLGAGPSHIEASSPREVQSFRRRIGDRAGEGNWIS